MVNYRLTRPDELSSLHPLVPDWRPRLSVPISGCGAGFSLRPSPPGPKDPAHSPAAGSVLIGPLLHPFDVARLISPARGHDAWSAANDPAILTPDDPALHTFVHLSAWRQCGRNIILRARFECREPDPARIEAMTSDAAAPKDPLDVDYVSLLVNMDRTHEKIIEIGVTCRGDVFTRPWTQSVSAHNCEPTPAAAKVAVIGTAQRRDAGCGVRGAGTADGGPQQLLTEVATGAKFDAARAAVRFDKRAWFVELELPFNMFGDYADPGVLYPANFLRVRKCAVQGAPAGIPWTATANAFTWAPVRWQADEFEKAGFLALGHVSPEEAERQVRSIDSETDMARIRRRAAFVSRKRDSHDTWRRQIDPARLETQWLPRAVPGFESVRHGFALNNSRQIVTLPDCSSLVLAEDADRLTLAVTQRTIDPVGGSVRKVVPLIGGKDGRLRNAGLTNGDPMPAVSHASMVRDISGALHVLFSVGDEVWHATHATPERTAALESASAWTVRRLPLPPRVRPYDVETTAEGGMSAVFADSAERMWLADLSGGKPQLLPFPGRCPVLARARDGGMHLAFERNATIYYVRLTNGERRTADDRRRTARAWQVSEPVMAAYAVALFPAIIEADGRPLIAFQYLGTQKADRAPELYIAERERTGGGIGCAWLDAAGRWQRRSVMDYREIAVRRMNPTQYMLDMVRLPHNGRVFLMPDENWRPCLGMDGQGVIRAAWQNTTREHAFTAQWTGGGFARPEELAGPLPAATPHIALEKYAPGTDLTYALVAERRLILDRQAARAAQLDRSDEVYFLDESVVLRRTGLRREFNPLRRHSLNPILEDPAAGRGAGRDGLHRPSALRLPGGDWAMTVQRFGGGSGLFAMSADGLRWTPEQPKATLARLRGADRKALDGFLNPRFIVENVSYGQRVFEDLVEKDPAKRFKAMTLEGHHTDAYAVRRVWYSADGRRWRKGPAAVGNNTLNETHLPNLYDPWDIPARRFKMYGRTTTPQGRTLAMLWSGDFIHWHGTCDAVVREDPLSRREASPSAPVRWGHVILEGSATPAESEHYYCLPWIEAGHYFLLYAVLCADGHKALRLAFSRDGFHFKRVADDWLMTTGAPGEFDNGSIDAPFIVPFGDELRLYYSAGGEKHGSLPHTAQHGIGLATIERKRWSFYRREEDAASGQITTVPFAPADLRERGLTVNAVAGAGDLRVEALDAATGAPLPGYGAAECDTLADGFETPVTWRGRPLPGADRPVSLRFILAGARTRLYSFALPRREKSLGR
jgi:hypothetical protein